MSWQKFCDRARESRKVRRASPEAVTLWWAVGNWCCEHKTDGFIARDELCDAWRPIGRPFDHEAVARECIELGLFIDHGQLLEVHDFLEFNESKEKQDERKAKDARRADAYRQRKKALVRRGVTADVTRDEVRDETRDATRDERRTSAERHAADDTGDPSAVRHAPPDPTRPAPPRPEIGVHTDAVTADVTRDEVRDETRDGAREEDAGGVPPGRINEYDLFNGYRSRWDARFPGRVPDGGRYAPQLCADAELWREVLVKVRRQAVLSKVTEHRVAEVVLDALFEDEFAPKTGFNPKLLLSKFTEFAAAVAGGSLARPGKKSGYVAQRATAEDFGGAPERSDDFPVEAPEKGQRVIGYG